VGDREAPRSAGRAAPGARRGPAAVRLVSPVDVAIDRWVVTALAKSWEGTPFHHAAAVRGSGVDCAHLAAAVYEDAGVLEDGKLGYYAPEWYVHEDAERLLLRVAEFCVKVERPEPGDLALFQFGRVTAHVAIVTEWPGVVHADRMRAQVIRDVIEPEGPLARRLRGFWSPRCWHPEAL
jgi:cell wall-associated NlpC family hydrolase